MSHAPWKQFGTKGPSEQAVGIALSRFKSKMRRRNDLRREALFIEEHLLDVDGLLPE